MKKTFFVDRLYIGACLYYIKCIFIMLFSGTNTVQNLGAVIRKNQSTVNSPTM